MFCLANGLCKPLKPQILKVNASLNNNVGAIGSPPFVHCTLRTSFAYYNTCVCIQGSSCIGMKNSLWEVTKVCTKSALGN